SLVFRGAVFKVMRVGVLTLVVVAAAWGGLEAMPDHGGQIMVALRARLGQMVHLEDYRQGTAGERLVFWTMLLRDVKRNPFWGHGLDAYQKYSEEKTRTTEN